MKKKTVDSPSLTLPEESREGKSVCNFIGVGDMVLQALILIRWQLVTAWNCSFIPFLKSVSCSPFLMIVSLPFLLCRLSCRKTNKSGSNKTWTSRVVSLGACAGTHTQAHTHTHSWFVVFSHFPHFLHTHTVWHCFFFSIFPCCRIPLRAVKKCTRGSGKTWIKPLRQVFSRVHTRRTPSPTDHRWQTTGCVWNV